jgi:hypothetical protein
MPVKRAWGDDPRLPQWSTGARTAP